MLDQEWATDRELENFFDGLRAQINQSEILDVFPDAKEDYIVCLRYLQEIGDDPQVEEIADDIQSKVKAGQAAWDQIFSLLLRTENTTPGDEREVFQRDMRFPGAGG